MSAHRLTGLARAAAAGGLLVLAAAACNEDRTRITRPFGPYSINFRLVPDGRALPHGDVTFRRVATDSSITLNLGGLEKLTSGVYQLWLADSTGGAPVKAV